MNPRDSNLGPGLDAKFSCTMPLSLEGNGKKKFGETWSYRNTRVRQNMHGLTLSKNFVPGILLLLAIGSGFALLVLLNSLSGPGTPTFGGNTEIVRLGDGSARLRLDDCKLTKFKSEFAELLMVEKVSAIDLRDSILDDDVFFSLRNEGSLKTLGLSGCVLTNGCVPLICDLSQLKKLTIIDCGVDQASLAEINNSLTGCEVIPRVSLAPK